MNTITISDVPGIDAWRAAARTLLHAGVAPHDIIWQTQETRQDDLFSPAPAPYPLKTNPPKNTSDAISNEAKINIPKAAIALFERALCHNDVERFAVCYRILWRLVHENKHLLGLKTDVDVMHLMAFVKAVRRDAYKMSAYLRFREVKCGDHEHFVAWYEPEHYSLELKIDFFKTRFRNMYWSILTPYRAAHWDMNTITLEDNPDSGMYPKDDHIEQYWLTYYANIFNPARPKKGAMLSAMPKKYWKNMPETVLIDDLLRGSEAKAMAMIDKK